MSQYHAEKIARYKRRLESMSERELAAEGLIHMRVSVLVAVIVAIACAFDLLLRPDSVIGAVLLMFIGFCAPFMLAEYVILRRMCRTAHQQQEGE